MSASIELEKFCSDMLTSFREGVTAIKTDAVPPAFFGNWVKQYVSALTKIITSIYPLTKRTFPGSPVCVGECFSDNDTELVYKCLLLFDLVYCRKDYFKLGLEQIESTHNSWDALLLAMEKRSGENRFLHNTCFLVADKYNPWTKLFTDRRASSLDSQLEITLTDKLINLLTTINLNRDSRSYKFGIRRINENSPDIIKLKQWLLKKISSYQDKLMIIIKRNLVTPTDKKRCYFKVDVVIPPASFTLIIQIHIQLAEMITAIKTKIDHNDRHLLTIILANNKEISDLVTDFLPKKGPSHYALADIVTTVLRSAMLNHEATFSEVTDVVSEQ